MERSRIALTFCARSPVVRKEGPLFPVPEERRRRCAQGHVRVRDRCDPPVRRDEFRQNRREKCCRKGSLRRVVHTGRIRLGEIVYWLNLAKLCKTTWCEIQHMSAKETGWLFFLRMGRKGSVIQATRN
jgi:hypothetical protein